MEEGQVPGSEAESETSFEKRQCDRQALGRQSVMGTAGRKEKEFFPSFQDTAKMRSGGEVRDIGVEVSMKNLALSPESHCLFLVLLCPYSHLKA